MSRRSRPCHHHAVTPKRFARTRRAAMPLLAAGVVGAILPVSTPAQADDGPGFGYSFSATASPIKIEIFEPTIPIPATPQAELELGYTKISGDTGSSRARASFLWPGDPVGEGAKTIIENLGLPPELSGPLAAQGYPIQVNAVYPSDQQYEAQEPFPGTAMRVSASATDTVAMNGYSTDCYVEDPSPDSTTAGNEGSDGSDAGSGDNGSGGFPPIPGLSKLLASVRADMSAPSVSRADAANAQMGAFGQAITGQQAERADTGSDSGDSSDSGSTDGDTPSADSEECVIPAQLAAIVDLAGYVSNSRLTAGADGVESSTRAALGDVSLLGGLVTMSGITAKAISSSDGSKILGVGRSTYGTLTVAGIPFTLGPDGALASGAGTPIPGLSGDPAKALEQLGITITVPQPVYEKSDGQISTTTEALVVQIDTGPLHEVLSKLPLAQVLDAIVGPIPFPGQSSIFKSLITALPGLSPRIVVHLGTATSTIQTAGGIAPPPIDPTPSPGPDDNTDNGGSDISGGGDVPPPAIPPSDTGDLGADPPATPIATTPLGSGLPPLNSVPGALLIGGVALAAVLGSYLRKLGAAALGGGSACTHGLESGLPDLRQT